MELSTVQKEAVGFYEGCCDVIASAGSGKTSVLVNRIVNLISEHGVDPGNILAITFSKKVKENMQNRLQGLISEYSKLVNIETFHSFGYRIIRKFDRRQYEILDMDWKKVKIIEEILQQRFRMLEPDGRLIADILQYISTQKNHGFYPDKSKMGKYYQAYESYKKDNNQIDFDDMLIRCYEILQENNEALEYCQEKFRFILADEMQDTNAVQFSILRLISGKYHNVFFVGDPLQAIYEWRGSDNTHIMNFDQEWPDATIINLNKNYRSSQDIVLAANHFAQCIPETEHKHYVESIADKGSFEKPHYVRHKNEVEEANNISKVINELVTGGYAYKDFAILTRTNAQLQNFEAALCANDIPHSTIDGVSFVNRREIKIVLSYLRLVSDINDDEAFEYIYNRPNRYLGKAFLRDVKLRARRDKISLYCAMFKVSKDNWKYKNGVNDLFTVVKTLSDSDYRNVSYMINDLRELINLDSYVSKDLCDDMDDSRIENLNALCHMASNYTDVKRFISVLNKIAKEAAAVDTNSDVVQLMTIHKSKGLEFPVVFVAGVNQGLLPHVNNKNVDEEKRLMYVAMTRAEKILYISSTEQYNGDDTKESEFIAKIF